MDIKEIIFNTKNPAMLFTGAIGIFLAIIFLGVGTLQFNFPLELSVIGAFVLLGLSFGLTRNVLVPIFISVTYNLLIIFSGGREIEGSDIMIWVFQGLAIAIIVILINIIVTRKTISVRNYAITGAIVGFIFGLFSLVQVIPALS